MLCFGTFCSLLKCAAIQSVTNRSLLESIFRCFDPDFSFDEVNGDTQVSRLMTCAANIKTLSSRTDADSESITQKAIKSDRTKVICKFRELVIPLMDLDKKNALILALRNVVKKDKELNDNHYETFKNYLGITPRAFSSKMDCELTTTLYGLLMYTIVIGNNTLGKQTINEIQKPSFFEGYMKSTLKVNVKVASKDELRIIDSTNYNFSNYLQEAHKKYHKIKTLLYSDEPHEFAKFFVCNDITKGATNRYDSKMTIKNATSKSLQSHYFHSILTGIGGMGKSMMLRHFLLYACENFELINKIPALVDLRRFSDKYTTLEDFVYSQISSLDPNLTKQIYKDNLVTGNFLFLLDGIDEINSSYLILFKNELSSFVDKYRMVQIVMTSRPFSSFIEYNRFAVLNLDPFSHEQALEMVKKCEFRPDTPEIKEKFYHELDKHLYYSHHEFAENPLLLTIMMITFEQYAEIPSKMHYFYREAYYALAAKHDANKGFNRPFKTGLNADQFADLFGEFCARTYVDEKIEFSHDDIKRYLSQLKTAVKFDNSKINVDNFIFDLCNNLCLLYEEGHVYHFIHRSFQEYFCAYYFSMQRDSALKQIGNFFENRQTHSYTDRTFEMLYDMIPEKVEEFIYLPYLKELFEYCDSNEGYKSFLIKMYPELYYEIGGDYPELSENEPSSYVYSCILDLVMGYHSHEFENIPGEPGYEVRVYVYATKKIHGTYYQVIDKDELPIDYYEYNGEPDVVGKTMQFDISDVYEYPSSNKETLEWLESNDCDLNKEYVIIRDYYEHLSDKVIPASNNLFDQFY